MKKYIYIDNDLITSLLAQTNAQGIKDLTNSTYSESESETLGTTKKEPHTSTEVGVGISPIKLGMKIDDELIEVIESKTLDRAASQSQTFKAHSINLLNEYLESNPIDITTLTGEFTLLDLDSMKSKANIILVDLYDSLFTNPALEKFHSENPKGTSNKGVKEKNLKKDLADQKEKMKTGLKVIDYLDLILPSSIYIETEEYIIPLNQKYLLYDTKFIEYIFNGNTSVIGLAGPGLKSKDLKESQNTIFEVFRTMSVASYALLENLGFDTSKKLLIPITWYQQSS